MGHSTHRSGGSLLAHSHAVILRTLAPLAAGRLSRTATEGTWRPFAHIQQQPHRTRRTIPRATVSADAPPNTLPGVDPPHKFLPCLVAVLPAHVPPSISHRPAGPFAAPWMRPPPCRAGCLLQTPRRRWCSTKARAASQPSESSPMAVTRTSQGWKGDRSCRQLLLPPAVPASPLIKMVACLSARRAAWAHAMRASAPLAPHHSDACPCSRPPRDAGQAVARAHACPCARAALRHHTCQPTHAPAPPLLTPNQPDFFRCQVERLRRRREPDDELPDGRHQGGWQLHR